MPSDALQRAKEQTLADILEAELRAEDFLEAQSTLRRQQSQSPFLFQDGRLQYVGEPEEEQPQVQPRQREPQPFVAESTGRQVEFAPVEDRAFSPAPLYAPTIGQGEIQQPTDTSFSTAESTGRPLPRVQASNTRTYEPVTTYLPAIGQASQTDIPQPEGTLQRLNLPPSFYTLTEQAEEDVIAPVPQESLPMQGVRTFIGGLIPEDLGPALADLKERVEPFGAPKTIPEKVVRGAAELGSTLVTFLPFQAASGYALSRIPQYTNMINKVSQESKILGQMTHKGFQNLLTFTSHGQAMIPSDATVKQRLENLGQSSITAALFTGAGSLGLIKKSAEKLEPVALFGIGAGSDFGTQDIPVEDRVINGLLLMGLHYTNQGISQATQTKRMRQALEGIGYTKEESKTLASEVTKRRGELKEALEKDPQEVVREAEQIQQRALAPERMQDVSGFTRLPGKEKRPSYLEQDNKWNQIKQAQKNWQESQQPNAEALYKDFKRKFVATEANLRKELLKYGRPGEKVYHEQILIRGANSASMRDIEQVRERVFKPLDASEKELVDNIRMYRRVIEIEERKDDVRNPFGIDKSYAERQLAKFQNETPEAVRNKVNRAIEQTDQVFREYLDKRLREGLITEKQHESLIQDYRYQPRRFLQHMDQQQDYTFGGKKIQTTSSGIDALQKGSEKALITDTEFLLQQYIARTNGIVMRNRAAKQMYRFAEEVPDNNIAEVVKPTGFTKDKRPKWPDVPEGKEKISLFINGKEQRLHMEKELAQEFIVRDPVVERGMANLARWVSGTPITKAMATGINPGFALTQLFRDTAHIYLVSNQYSSFLPKFIFKELPRDLYAVWSDTWRRQGRYNDYISEGGGLNFLTHQGWLGDRAFGKKIEQFKGIQQYLGYPGETTELWTRLALRERAMRNGYSSKEATAIARDYIDFSQGGSWAKAIDQAFPYFNASIQGSRKILQTAYERPGEFSAKVAQVGTFGLGLYYANRLINPEALSQVPDYEADNNWIITTPFAETQPNGEKRYYYLKIPKDQGQRLFAGLFEGVARRVVEGKSPTERWLSQAADAFPAIPGVANFPPMMSMIIALTMDTDTWTREEIWRGAERHPYAQYYADTPEIYKAVGEISRGVTDFVGLGPEHTISPVRLETGMKKIFTYGNLWTAMVGQGYKQLEVALQMNGAGEDEIADIQEKYISELPIAKRLVGLTPPPSWQAYDDAKELNIDESTARGLRNDALEERLRQLEAGAIEPEELYGWLSNFDRDEIQRLSGRIREWAENRNISSAALTMKRIKTPEKRAEWFVNYISALPADRRNALLEEIRQTSGIWSDEFQRELRKQLRNQ